VLQGLTVREPIIRRLAGNCRIPQVGTASKRARGRPLATATAILRPGDVLGGFRVDDVIGIGGMAIVYRAEQVSLGRPVALKVLSSKLTNDEVFRERFRREGMHAAALEHPNIVPVYDSDEQDGLLYLAMRLVEGTNLAELIQTRGLTADQTVEILRPIASALDTAHAGGLIHRDVKPQNILITDQGHPYLADFGVAKGSNTSGLTATGGFVGSVNYASPEQIKGLTLTSASDIYALTAVLYQCLTNRVPYPRETDAGIMHAHLTEPPPTLPVVAGADSDFHTVFARGMAKDPGARYGHAGDLINAAALSADRMPSIRRKAVPAFPDEPSGQAGAVDGDMVVVVAAEALAAESVSPAAEGTEIVSRDEMAELRRVESHTTADRRRTPAPESEYEVVPSSRRWPMVVAGGIGVIAVIVALALVLGSGAGTRASASHRGSSSESAELARFAGQLSQSLAPSVAARANPTGLSSSRPSTRAATARAIASADGRSATALSKLAPQPRERQAVGSLARALEGEGSALGRLASAAAADDRTAYASATTATRTAGAQLSSARAALYGMGFKGLPSLRALSIPGLPVPRVQHHRKSPAKVTSTTSAPAVASPAPESTVTATPTPAPSVPTPSAPAPTHQSSPQPQTEVAKPLS
jgi:serine/threonine protein kinase